MKFSKRRVVILTSSIFSLCNLNAFAQTYDCGFIVKQNGHMAKSSFNFDGITPLSGICLGNFEFSVLVADVNVKEESKQAVEIIISGMGVKSGAMFPKNTPWMGVVVEKPLFAQASCTIQD